MRKMEMQLTTGNH